MKTGKEIWKTKVAEWKEGYSITSAPTVANGVLMTGMTGGEYGVRGFVAGYDPETGKQLWRRHTTAGPGEKGHETWPQGDAYMRGGASTWITGSYDPELDLTYWGTSNGGPWDARWRPGDNLWVASVIALRPEDRRDRLALPVDARGDLRLRRQQRERPGRHDDETASSARC